MPGYRDNYPRRRPHDMPRGGRDPYGRPPRRYYPEDRRPSRPPAGYRGDYGRPRRPQRPPEYGYDARHDGYIGRRSSAPPIYDDFRPEYRDDAYSMPRNDFTDMGFGSNAGEPFEQQAGRYDSDADDMFFADEQEQRADYAEERESFDAEPEMSDDFDDFDDFDDLEDMDDLDEWLTERESPSRQQSHIGSVKRSMHPSGWSEENGFDGFEDDEDIRRAQSRPAPPGRGDWFEEEDSYFRPVTGGRNDRRGNNPPGNRRVLVFAVAGLVLVAALAAALLVIFRNPGSPMSLDLVLDSLTYEQAEVMIGGFIDKELADAQCSVTVDNRTENLRLADCEITYVGRNSDGVSEYVVGTDEDTGELERTEYAVSGMLRYNKTALRAFLDSLCGENSTPVVDPHFEIDYETSIMTVYPGSDGWGVDVDTFLSQVSSSIAASGGDDMRIVCSGGALSARKLSAAEIYKQAATDPVDAYTTTDSAGQTIYHSEINGVEFDQAELERQIAAGGTQWQIPVKVTFPKINLKEIMKYTFPDVLGSYYTYYSEGNRERSHNVALSAELINSMILEPGEQFSFNDRVGKRTAESGFKKAGVYAGEGTTEDYGGGICQTSSTLYYTCILANLQIDERRNHMYTVGYMQTAKTRYTVFGNDATVNWGSADYKFTNSKEYPIRIDIWAKDGVLTCEIRGTADGSTADFEYVTVTSTPYKIKYLKDNGSKDQAGQNGYVVDVYRVIYQDGVEVDRVKESRNNYTPMNKLIYTNEIPAGFEYGVEYEQDYTPSLDATGTSTTAPTEATEPAATTTTTAPPAPEEPPQTVG